MAQVRIVKRHTVATGTRAGRRGASRVLRGHSHAGHWRRLIYFVGTTLAIAAIAHASYQMALDAPYFRLTRLEIEGVSVSMAREIEHTVAQNVGRQHNLLTLNSAELLKKLKGYPRLRNLSVEKLYPDTLLVRGAEREPVAILNANTKGFYLIDNDGCVVEKLEATELRRYDFPYVTGVPMEQVQVGEKIFNPYLYRALDLIRVLEERNTELCARLSEIHVDNDASALSEGLTARFSGGLDVRFGDKNPIERLPALDLFLSKLQQENVDPFSMAYVDLRFNNQIVYMDRETALASLTGELEQLERELEAATSPAKAGGKRQTP